MPCHRVDAQTRRPFATTRFWAFCSGRSLHRDTSRFPTAIFIGNKSFCGKFCSNCYHLQRSVEFSFPQSPVDKEVVMILRKSHTDILSHLMMISLMVIFVLWIENIRIESDWQQAGSRSGSSCFMLIENWVDNMHKNAYPAKYDFLKRRKNSSGTGSGIPFGWYYLSSAIWKNNPRRLSGNSNFFQNQGLLKKLPQTYS